MTHANPFAMMGRTRDSVRRARTRSLALLIGLAVMPACTQLTDPSLRTLQGAFALRSVDGAPLPVLDSQSAAATTLLLADTLWADGGGHYTRVTITEVDSTARQYHATQHLVRVGAYKIRGDTVEFPFTCPPNASCVAPPVGRRTSDDALVITEWKATPFERVSRYVRVQ